MIRDYEGFKTEALAATAGGEVDFQTLLDSLSPEHRPQAYDGLKVAIGEGALKREVRRDTVSGRMVLYVSQAGGE